MKIDKIKEIEQEINKIAFQMSQDDKITEKDVREALEEALKDSQFAAEFNNKMNIVLAHAIGEAIFSETAQPEPEQFLRAASKNEGKKK